MGHGRRKRGLKPAQNYSRRRSSRLWSLTDAPTCALSSVLRPRALGPTSLLARTARAAPLAQGRKGAGNTPDYSALSHAMTLRQVLRVRGRVPDPQGVPGPGRLDSLLQDHPLPHGWCCRPLAPSPHARPCSNHAPCGESQRRAAVLHVRSPGAIPRIYSGSAKKGFAESMVTNAVWAASEAMRTCAR